MESQTIEASDVVIRPAVARPGALRRAWDSDILHSFRRSPVTVVAAILTAVSILSAIGAPWLAPHDTLDLPAATLRKLMQTNAERVFGFKVGRASL